MTVQEKLIKNEKEAIECLEKNRPTSGYYMLNEAIDISIKALEKQIPKKPIIDNRLLRKQECPVCESLKCEKYCSNCGQAIDWSEEE